MSSILFDDIFVVTEKDPNGKFFDKVSRFVCKGEEYEMDLVIDINTDIYPMNKDEKFTLTLATTLNLDGRMEIEGSYMASDGETLADEYEYVMHGKVFKFGGKGQSVDLREIVVSFGGLLMQLTGDARNLHGISLDQNLYLLIRKN
tara:strand:- start:563 stop:1000 length:438 start_codon:yes stop_codon:yes gene_type:complete